MKGQSRNILLFIDGVGCHPSNLAAPAVTVEFFFSLPTLPQSYNHFTWESGVFIEMSYQGPKLLVSRAKSQVREQELINSSSVNPRDVKLSSLTSVYKTHCGRACLVEPSCNNHALHFGSGQGQSQL